MANNVYIGNRYVPVFADPVEWDNLRQYEPLTIVTYQGTAYTSKKTVPVGTALSNTDYWVVTGNYNAQVEEYRQEVVGLRDDVAGLTSDVSELDADVDRLTSVVAPYWFGNKFVCFGDSTAEQEDSYINQMIAKGVDITNLAVGGHSLVAYCDTIVQTNISAYDIVILNYGINDWQAGVPLFKTYQNDGWLKAIRQVFDYVNAQGKECLMILPWYVHRNDFTRGEVNNCMCSIDGYIDAAIKECEDYHFNYINLYRASGVNASNYTHWLNSGNINVHANAGLNNKVTRMMLNGVCFNNGYCFDNKYPIHVPFMKNGFTSLSQIESSVAGVRLPDYTGANIEVTQGTCMSYQIGCNEDDTLIIEGTAIVNSNLAIQMYEIDATFSTIAFTNPDNYRYGDGRFRCSIPLKGKKQYMVWVNSATGNGGYILGLKLSTVKNDCNFIRFQDGTKEGITLKSGIELSTYSPGPIITFTPYGYHVSPFRIKKSNGTAFALADELFTIKEGTNNVATLQYFPAAFYTSTGNAEIAGQLAAYKSTGIVKITALASGSPTEIMIDGFDVITAYV